MNYRNAKRWAVVVVQAEALVAARMKVALSRVDHGFDFTGGDAASATQIPKEMISRLLDDGDLRRLQSAVMPRKPRTPSVRRSQRRVGKR